MAAVLESLGMSHRLKHKPLQLGACGVNGSGRRLRGQIDESRRRSYSPMNLTGNLDVEIGVQDHTVLEKLHRDEGQTIVM
jgi:predicted ABC-type transport system involved in lysophospholipase L1 biosynthesis ATPase subunit